MAWNTIYVYAHGKKKRKKRVEDSRRWILKYKYIDIILICPTYTEYKRQRNLREWNKGVIWSAAVSRSMDNHHNVDGFSS